MILKSVTEIRDPVHGYVKITEVEREIIDSPFLQRLRRIHQLAGAYLVYPGAVHTRFEHVVGAMHVAGSIAESLADHSDISAEQVQKLRLAALLHDVGHGPFSHTFDEVLTEKTRTTHEDISRRVVTETSISDILEKHGFHPRKMASLAVGAEQSEPRFMNDIIAGGLSADMMDYLLRDSYFTGVEYGRVDIYRIVYSLYISRDRLALDKAALYAFEAMLLARYQMFKAVYFHRTARAAQLMIARSMELADEELGLTDLTDIDRYLEMTDELVIQRIASLQGKDARSEEARRLATDFRNRILVKCVYERLVHRKGHAPGQLFGTSRARNAVVRELSRRSGVDTMRIYLDVPTTPSVPYTSSRETFDSISIISRVGRRRTYHEVPISELPLAGAIAGFMDMFRVYTRPGDKERVARAASELFGNEGPTDQIS